MFRGGGGVQIEILKNPGTVYLRILVDLMYKSNSILS